MTSDLDGLGEVIAEQTHAIIVEHRTAWERVMRLHIKPRPAWCPEPVWRELVALVVVQSEQRNTP